MKPRTKQESFWHRRFLDGRRLCVNTTHDSRYTKRGMGKQRRQTDKNAISDEVSAMTIEPEKEPYQLPEYGQHDIGKWTVEEEGHYVASSEFTHDVWLKVGGDFLDEAQRKKYAENIAKRLNATKPEVNEVGALKMW